MYVFERGLWSHLVLAEWYARYPWAVDGFLYLVLFVGLAKATVGRRFEGRGGAAVAAALGTALAIGTATLAYRGGFTLANLGGPAWLILLTLVGVMLFDMLRSVGMRTLPALAGAVLTVVATMSALGEAFDGWLVASGLLVPIQLAAVAATLALAWWVVGLLPGRFRMARFRGGSDLFPTRESMDRNWCQAEREIATSEEIDQSLLPLLEKLLAEIEQSGVSRKSQKMLREIQRRERLVARSHRRMLKALAHRQWKATKSRQHLPDDLKELLIAARDNVSEFDRNLELAQVAHRSANVPLLSGAVERLIRLEKESVRIAEILHAELLRLRPSPRAGNQARRDSGGQLRH